MWVSIRHWKGVRKTETQREYLKPTFLSIYLSIYFRNRFLQTICIVFDEEKNKVCKEFESQLGSLHVQVTYFIC